MKKITITSLTAAVLAFPAITMAAPVIVKEANVATDASAAGLANIIDKLGTWALIILGALATFYIILAAFTFLLAKGDSKKITDARSELTYALVAVVIGAIAKLLTSVIAGIAGGL